jgi:outer membrane protein TolC
LTARQALVDVSLLARLRAARDNAGAAGFDARSAAELSGAIAGLAYLRVLGAEETVRARLQDSTVAASLFDQARRMVDAGVSPTIDATRSEVNFAAVRTQLELARNAVGRARLDLASALDLPAGTPLVLEDSLVTPTLTLPASVDSAVAFAELHRSERAAERLRSEAQRRTLSAIRKENLPSLGLGGMYQQSGQETGNLSGSYALQIGVSVPILDGFKRQTRAGEQEALLDVQLAREHQVERQIDIEVRQSLLDLASAQDLMRIAADRVRLADDEMAQAQQRFNSGVSGSVETTQSQAASILAHDAFIQARMAYAIARLGAYRSLGVLDQLR